jgi:hypothetical protein
MTHFMRRYCNRSDRSSMVVTGAQSYRFGCRVKVIATFIGFLYHDAFELKALNQMSGQFTAGPGQIRLVAVMLFHHVSDPELGQISTCDQ